MPQVQNADIYNAIYEVARERFADQQAIEPYLVTRPEGSPMYRYVGYRNAAPQVEQAGRTVWAQLAGDTQNRWTGRSPNPDVVEGAQGLYLSGEHINPNQPFPELEHYIDQHADANDPVFYYHYEQGVEPELVLGRVGELRSMFMFTASEELNGINLSLNGHGEHPLLEEILETARQRYPDAFEDGVTLADLYNAGDDASFCRAIGNAVLETTDVHYFETTSVRDGASSNVIMRGQQGHAVEALTPQGRGSFFLNQEGGVDGVFTILDLQYNAVFEQDGMGVLPPRDALVANLNHIAGQMSDRIIAQYQEALEVQAPTQNMEEIGQSLLGVQQSIQDGQMGDALARIRDISQRIEDFRGAGGLTELETNSFDLVSNVMRSLDSITDAARVAQEAPDVRAEDAEGIDFQDPLEDQVEPHFEEPAH